MKQLTLSAFALALCFFHAPINTQAQSAKIELQNGDRVVFVGDGFFENELDYGYLEYTLTTAWPDRNITFRNIGWSGDTPTGTSRDHFTNPPTAYDHLIEQIKSTNPTVAFVGYGAHIAFEDILSVEDFMIDLNALLDTLEALDVRIALVSPAPHDPNTSPAPDVNKYNEQLGRVSAQIEEAAQTRGHWFVDFHGFLLTATQKGSKPISDNGYQLNAYGYCMASYILNHNIRSGAHSDGIAINLKTGSNSPEVSEVKKMDKAVTFTINQERLPLCAIPITDSPREQRVAIAGLDTGTYTLWGGNHEIATFTSEEWRNAIDLPALQQEQAEQLRDGIIRKNRTYFYQYRPQNETYLVGFREYEQGQNARELQLLDPLIGEMENEIGRLRVPKTLTLRLVAQ